MYTDKNAWDHIRQEYEKRNLVALIAEYKRLDMFVSFVVDELNGFLDDDTEQRYELVKEVICETLLKEYDRNFVGISSFKYWEDVGILGDLSSAPPIGTVK